jgi:polyisoprenoid-binding protein YceI
MKPLTTALVILLFAASPLFSAESKYTIDPAHTNVNFTVSHMVISSVTGKFKDVSGTLVAPGDEFTDAKIDVLIAAKSINTENDKRDEHLRSADFFDVAKFPDIKFKSTSVKKNGPKEYTITGDLTMHGITKSVDLKTVFKGSAKSPWGQTVAAFTASTTIARKEWGLVWNKAMEAGGVLVGDDVDLTFNVELVKQ